MSLNLDQIQDEIEKAADEVLYFIDKGYFKIDEEDKINLDD